MKIAIRGKETSTGNLEKVKFDTESKTYITGKYNVYGGDLIIQASSNKEVKDIVNELKIQGFTLVDDELKMNNKEQKIVAIVDENECFVTTYYDITDMTGELKDYYQWAEDGEDVSFESYGAYESDLLKRGAKRINVIEHKI